MNLWGGGTIIGGVIVVLDRVPTEFGVSPLVLVIVGINIGVTQGVGDGQTHILFRRGIS